MSTRDLVRALRDPQGFRCDDFNGLIAAARAEQLIGSLACRLQGQALSERVEAMLEAARRDAAQARVQALWEIEMTRRALQPLGRPVVLLKGNAFHAAGLAAAEGRFVGDLDILVPFDALEAVEAALVAAGWERMKEGYDDLYYRRWMHELPPLIHRTRDKMIDVHHTILPRTARPRPDAAALIADAVPLGVGSGLFTLSQEDMIVHAAAHLFADGDLAGGLRNLWDIDRLLRQYGGEPGFWPRLATRARRHQLRPAVARALRLAARLYGTPVDRALAGRPRLSDRLFAARLLARNGWGQPVRPALRFAFYVRSHLLRMPPLMLARHLWVKARA